MALPLKLLKPLASTTANLPHYSHTSSPAVTVLLPSSPKPQILVQAAPKMSTTTEPHSNPNPTRVIDSHLHLWASPQEAADKYTLISQVKNPGHVDFLLQSMEEAGVDGALYVQLVNHKFDHSYVTSVLKKYPTKFVGCCLANPAEDGSGVKQLEQLVLKMTNDVGKALFSKAGELGVPVGFMCMKMDIFNFYTDEKPCQVYFPSPSCRNEEESHLLRAFKAFRIPTGIYQVQCPIQSRLTYPYQDLAPLLSKVITSFAISPFVVFECGYKEAKEAASSIANQITLSSSDLEWIMGKTVGATFPRSMASLIDLIGFSISPIQIVLGNAQSSTRDMI